MTPHAIHLHARHFLVWRLARQGYTASEIAREVGMTRPSICRLCAAKGWPITTEPEGDATFLNFVPVDRMIAN